jgi:TPR repeat protein
MGERMPPSSVHALLLCPISCDVMEDPVILLPAGMTYDRKQICKSLLHHPNLDPSSGVRYDGKLQYCDNVALRQLLMETYGDKAYRKYDDSGFQPRYQEAWNTGKFAGRVTEAYERVHPLLWGTRLSETINVKAALELVEMFPEDAVMVALKAMFLEPEIFRLTVESCVKDLGLARNAWDRALGLGLREQAITGNAWAQWAEGRRQFFREKNNIAAVEWTRKAADQGFAAAQWTLGWMYGDGLGVAKNPSLDLEWTRKAADQGFAAAQYHLGMRYHKGDFGVEKSPSLALEWWRQAAMQGFPAAQCALGLDYYCGGLGVEKNYSLAVEWHRKAAEQGLAQSQGWLGILYHRGNGVEQSYTFAVDWYRKAAVQGEYQSQNNLGNMYERGLGVAKSNSLAVEWYRKAAIQGSDIAKDRLQRLLPGCS